MSKEPSNKFTLRTNEPEYPESEIDELESLYFDTISLADSEAAAAVIAAHRKSLSQSRNTVYHSAVDLAGDETPSKRRSLRLENGKNAVAGRSHLNPNYRHSSALEHYNGPNGSLGGTSGDQTDAAIAAQVRALQNGRGVLSSTPNLYTDETHRRFQDGVRCVDFVLAFNGEDIIEEHQRKRKTFEDNLEKEGLHLERDISQRIHFVKIHAPNEVLRRYAEILKFKLPIKSLPGEERIKDSKFDFKDTLSNFFSRCLGSILLDPAKFPNQASKIHFEYSEAFSHLFDLNDSNLFDAGTRNAIINCILEHQRFDDNTEEEQDVGIEQLLEDCIYDSAYPLHDDTDRKLLLDEWANLKKWISLQPLDKVKEYFGPRVAIYFAWLGFYTHMLIPISIFGIFCFLYGIFAWRRDPISGQICYQHKETIMCPQCDRNCDYWKLGETCEYSKTNAIIDNNMTIFFTVVISLWTVLYLELWKRYSASLIHRWGLTGFSQDAEYPRPQYLAKLRQQQQHWKRNKKDNTVNEKFNWDTDVPFWKYKFLPNFTSYSIVVLFICISIIAVFSMAVYRMAQKASHSILGNEDSMTYKIMVLPMTAGIIDLIIISLLDYAYSYLAVKLTDLEYSRTQTEYDESLTIKNYVFQFVNYYSSLFYIGFLKGKFLGQPAKYNRIFGFRQEECHPGGCLMELCMQLAIIMIGKQAVNAVIEMFVPYLSKKLRRLCKKQTEEDQFVKCNQWTEDYSLEPWTNNSLYAEYLEMVLQFGFVTIFGLAFPLAPLLALINNVLEVRLDGLKMLNLHRRAVAQRVSNIGVWFNIMTIVSKIAVTSSAIIIAFSTNFIPKLVYKTVVNDNSLEGYLNFTLAYFNTEDFQVQPVLNASRYGNVTTCRYAEFRNPPWDDHPYKRPTVYFKILIARLLFIVIYQNVIGVLQTVVTWAIPDKPRKLLKRIKDENLLIRQHIMKVKRDEHLQVENENKDVLSNKVLPRNQSDNGGFHAESITENVRKRSSNNDVQTSPV